jgi:hypothetical protein
MKVRSDIVSDNSGSENVALTSVAVIWFLTIPAPINIALTIALRQHLTMPDAIHVTDKYDSEMDSGSDMVSNNPGSD